MSFATLADLRVHYRDEGDQNGAPVVFANSLATDLGLWDDVLPLLPKGLRIIRYDMRGHGQTDCPPAPYSMGSLISDAERLMDNLGARDAVFVGLSIGGMIAQGLAVKRLDLTRAIVLSNTAAKIATPEIWAGRIAQVETGGMEAVVDQTMERWFSKPFRQSPEIARWRALVLSQPVPGYVGCAAAISGTDFYTPTSGLRLPTLAIAGSEDGATPPDLVREMADLVPGARFELIRRAGHLPCVEQPAIYAEILSRFLREIGHVR